MSKAADDEFVDCGTKVGIEIWRIEELRPVPWPIELYGKFCSGDSYILLHVCIIYCDLAINFCLLNCIQTEEVRGKLQYHIHFWLGTGSTIVR